MNVPELLTATEGKTLKFKRDLSSLKPILKTLVAFANTSGGTLVIGVQDDGAVVGIADALRGGTAGQQYRRQHSPRHDA